MAERMLELGAILIGLAALARLAVRLGIPTVPLYLLAGLAFGTGGIVPLVTTTDFVRIGAEIGLVLLLFMLGLENSASELTKTMRRSTTAGAIDIVGNAVPGIAAGFLLGWGALPALFLGGITMASSSGIAAKILGDLGWAPRLEGRFVVTIAVIEDLAMAVYLPVLGAFVFGGSGRLGLGLLVSLCTIAAVLLLLVLGSRVQTGLSERLFSRSDEALLLTILGIALTVAGLAEALQISAAVGALVAGIMLSGRSARTALHLLRPLRDLFAAFFFAFIGLSVDPGDLPEMLVPAAVLALVGVGTKALTGYVGGRSVALTSREQRRATVALIPRGEFSLAIAGLAVTAGVDPRIAPLTVAYVVLLAIAGPLLARIVRKQDERPVG